MSILNFKCSIGHAVLFNANINVHTDRQLPTILANYWASFIGRRFFRLNFRDSFYLCKLLPIAQQKLTTMNRYSLCSLISQRAVARPLKTLYNSARPLGFALQRGVHWSGAFSSTHTEQCWENVTRVITLLVPRKV